MSKIFGIGWDRAIIKSKIKVWNNPAPISTELKYPLVLHGLSMGWDCSIDEILLWVYHVVCNVAVRVPYKRILKESSWPSYQVVFSGLWGNPQLSISSDLRGNRQGSTSPNLERSHQQGNTSGLLSKQPYFIHQVALYQIYHVCYRAISQ